MMDSDYGRSPTGQALASDPSRREHPLRWAEDQFSAGSRYTAENGWKVQRGYDGRVNYYTVLDEDGCETRNFRKFADAIQFAEYASAMEARRAETGTGSVHDSAAPQEDAQPSSGDPHATR